MLRRASFNVFQSKYGGIDGGIPVPLGAVWESVLGSTAAVLLGWNVASLKGNAISESSGVGSLTQRLTFLSLAIYKATIFLLHQRRYGGSLLDL